MPRPLSAPARFSCAVCCAIAMSGQFGCSSTSGSSPPSEGGAGDVAVPDSMAVEDGASAECAAGEAGMPGLTLTWQVVVQAPSPGTGEPDAGDASAAAAALPVAGAMVCVDQRTDIACATTDSTGRFTLSGLPAATRILVTVDAAGYRSIALPVETSAPVDATRTPVSMARATDPSPPIGETVDWANEGQVEFFAIGPGAIGGSGPVGDPGTRVTLTPMSGTGPLFLTDQNTFDAGAAALIDVAGVAFNVTPGSYALTFDDPTGDCEPITQPFAGWGYPGSTHQVTFPVLKGYTTLVGVYCAKTTQTGGGADAGDAGSPLDGASDGGTQPD
jgi:hypothetical protein